MNAKLPTLLSPVLLLLAVIGTSCSPQKVEKVAESSNAKIHQIGLVWLKDAGNAEARQKVINAVHDFGRLIPEVKSAAVGPSDGPEGPFLDISYDVCFILTFEDEESRQRYNDHPVHQKAAKEVFLPLSEKLQFYRFVAQ